MGTTASGVFVRYHSSFGALRIACLPRLTALWLASTFVTILLKVTVTREVLFGPSVPETSVLAFLFYGLFCRT